MENFENENESEKTPKKENRKLQIKTNEEFFSHFQKRYPLLNTPPQTEEQLHRVLKQMAQSHARLNGITEWQKDYKRLLKKHVPANVPAHRYCLEQLTNNQ